MSVHKHILTSYMHISLTHLNYYTWYYLFLSPLFSMNFMRFQCTLTNYRISKSTFVLIPIRFVENRVLTHKYSMSIEEWMAAQQCVVLFEKSPLLQRLCQSKWDKRHLTNSIAAFVAITWICLKSWSVHLEWK